MRHLSILLCLTLLSCSSPPPYLVLTVEDPGGVTTGLTALRVSVDDGRDQRVATEGNLPATMTLTVDEAGEHRVRVEALDTTGIIARGSVLARFSRSGTPSATVQLGPACDTAEDCDDGVFCTGTETCEEGRCVAGVAPCQASFPCVQSDCIEGVGGAGACRVSAVHSACGATEYCNPLAGCVPGKGCLEDADCQDGSVCNGQEKCDDFLCTPGIPSIPDDQDSCTFDGCNDARSGSELDPIFHLPDPSRDGNQCDLPGGGGGICVASSGGCTASSCGDGFVDLLAGEQCDDANTVDTDGCVSGCQTALCGDGFVWAGIESCDDGRHCFDGTPCTTPDACVGIGDGTCAPRSGDGCRSDCLKQEVCGDAVLDTGEVCDDGNTNPNDGCNACRRTHWLPQVLSGVGPTGGDPLEQYFFYLSSVAVDLNGNAYVAAPAEDRVWRLDATTGFLSVIAGTGLPGFSGDGGPARNAQLDEPTGLVTDGSGNLYISDAKNHRVRRVCLQGAECTPGYIDTIAGNGTSGFSGDGGPATDAQLRYPVGLAADARGNVLIADSGNNRVRRVCLDGADCLLGHIETLAGTGTSGFSGDGDLATLAALRSPYDVDLDAAGNIYIADWSNFRIRRICADAKQCTVGNIDTIAGVGSSGFAPDGTLATAATIYPDSVAVDHLGNILFDSNSRIRRICMNAAAGCAVGYLDTISVLSGSPRVGDVSANGDVWVAGSAEQRVYVLSDGTTTAVAGGGAPSDTSGRAAATSVDVGYPYRVAAQSGGNIFVAGNARIWRSCVDGVGCTRGTVGIVAGTGEQNYSGDGGPAVDAAFGFDLDGLVFDAAGDLLISDTGANRIRKLCLSGTGCTLGHVDLVAGNGAWGYNGDGIPATTASLGSPAGLDVDDSGNIYIADKWSNRIRRIGTDGIIETIAGDGNEDYYGDGDDAKLAALAWPGDVQVTPSGNVLILDSGNGVTREVDLATGFIDTVWYGVTVGSWAMVLDGNGDLIVSEGNAVTRVGLSSGWYEPVMGDGSYAFSGDGGPAVQATVMSPAGLALTAQGDLLVAETAGRVRSVCYSGIDCTIGNVETVIGPVDPIGDGELPTSSLDSPKALVEVGGSLMIADGLSGRIRRVDVAGGWVGTVVGYPNGHADEGAPARWSRLMSDPAGIAFDAQGPTLFVSEHEGHTIRAIDTNGDSRTWTVSTFAGELGTAGFVEDVGTAARFSGPAALLFEPTSRQLLVADSGNHVIRSIDVDGGSMSVLAGKPENRGFFGEDIAATDALFDNPEAIALGPDGSLYIADTQNNRVRRVASGIIDTVIGDGIPASSGEGQPARNFPVDRPRGLAVDSYGNLFVSSSTSLRMVTAGDDGIATGEDAVLTLFGRPPRTVFPEPATACLTDIAIVQGDAGAPDARLFVLDACAGYMLQLDRATIP